MSIGKLFFFSLKKLLIYPILFFFAKDLLKPGSIPEELFQLGAMFYRNKEKNGYPLCNFILCLPKRKRNPLFDNIFIL